MTNNVAVLNKQKYTKMVQALLEETLIAMDLANTMLIDRMPDGNTINFPRPEFQNVQQYTKYTDVEDQDLDFTNETLVINRTPIITFVYDDVDDLDNGMMLLHLLLQKLHIELNKISKVTSLMNIKMLTTEMSQLLL